MHSDARSVRVELIQLLSDPASHGSPQAKQAGARGREPLEKTTPTGRAGGIAGSQAAPPRSESPDPSHGLWCFECSMEGWDKDASRHPLAHKQRLRSRGWGGCRAMPVRARIPQSRVAAHRLNGRVARVRRWVGQQVTPNLDRVGSGAASIRADRGDRLCKGHA